MAISDEEFVASKRTQFSSFTKLVFWVAVGHLIALALMAYFLL